MLVTITAAESQRLDIIANDVRHSLRLCTEIYGHSSTSLSRILGIFYTLDSKDSEEYVVEVDEKTNQPSTGETRLDITSYCKVSEYFRNVQ